MPWTKQNYPESMKNLEPEIRNKAIDIANALEREGSMDDEGNLIATSISQAKDWATHQEKEVPKTDTDVKKHGTDQYVTPHEEGWALKTENSEKPYKVYPTKQEAIEEGAAMAKKHAANLIIQGEDGKIVDKRSYNQQNQ